MSSVTNMGSMFRNAKAFDHSLECWDDTLVTTSTDMFTGATAFLSAFTRTGGGTDGNPSVWVSNTPNTASCCGNSAPTNGALGACRAVAHGDTCSPPCDAGYTLTGTMSCTDGTLANTAVCAAPSTPSPSSSTPSSPTSSTPSSPTSSTPSSPTSSTPSSPTSSTPSSPTSSPSAENSTILVTDTSGTPTGSNRFVISAALALTLLQLMA